VVGLGLLLLFNPIFGRIPLPLFFDATPRWASPFTDPIGWLRTLLVPWIVLGAPLAAMVLRLTVATTIEALDEDYVRTAVAKGLPRGMIIRRHIVRNSLIPVITYIGADVGALMGGAIVTERIFNINGVGYFIYRSVYQRDGQSVVGAVTVLVLVFLLVNLIVDILYGVLDPRISTD
jgi:oligopeptide transport system permease protein